MNPVDISPETVEREYDAIAEKWGVSAPQSDIDTKPETLTPEPNFEPERISSAESLAAQRDIDVPMVTLRKWEHDDSISPELIRNSAHVTREFVAKNTGLVIKRVAGLDVDQDVIDEFALSNAQLLVHYYPKGGVLEVMENYGLWFGALGSTVGLIFAVKQASEKKTLTTNAAGTQEDSDHA
ncbi:hypothetical protein QF117_09200 [Vibrio sp. YMD68]|uniref:hypothetical protein n=1 Tax=Vibrio sp. YMD68 TaxID=3042300 RepID=UPI00249AE5DE|nr:hypothetical protein [Vibrio sp. YMD68]WGW00341.1 hypothetical protein QF117_21175 [Vibrio sp. YMD68]WGW00978.1 hypothetical protein QF117_09200 [Vibrio sp. YMD68]